MGVGAMRGIAKMLATEERERLGQRNSVGIVEREHGWGAGLLLGGWVLFHVARFCLSPVCRRVVEM
eukprot:1239310-Prymnesium_polylepis.1